MEMFKNKEIKVVLKGKAKVEYNFLKNLVKEELSNGRTQTNNQKLLNSINKVIELLIINPHFGIHIAKRKIPKEYIIKYDAENLWKCNLIQHWRLIYTLKGDEIKIVSLVLDIFDHKKYNKKFRYKKN